MIRSSLPVNSQIKYQNISGTVETVDKFNTKVRSGDQIILIPNKDLVKEIVQTKNK
ncbi:MAG: hypothetical protein KatS3mg129_1410 [Leptospiraceae bacterium]|nr:MAG: hypothetical protein KatS3mg129_1410 [Leptospiraceae bacterium]